MLRSVHHPIATVALCLALHAAYVRPRVRLCHRERVHTFAAHGRQQIPFTLRVVAGHQDVLRTAKEVGQGHRPTTQLAFHKGEIKVG